MKTINGYKLTQRLKKIRSETYLSATDQALYHELVSICNEKRWPEVFSVKNDPLAASLNVTVKTMIKSRKTLTGCDLIFSSSQKDKRYGCIYSFVRDISSVNFTDDITTESTRSSVTSSVKFTDDTPFSPYYNIKTKNIENNTDSFNLKQIKHEENRKLSKADQRRLLLQEYAALLGTEGHDPPDAEVLDF